MDWSNLLSDGVISEETLNWIRPSWDQELAQAAEVREAQAHCGVPLFGSSSNCVDGGGGGGGYHENLRTSSQTRPQDDEDEDEIDEYGLLLSRKSITMLGGVSLTFYVDNFSTGHGNHVWHASIAMCVHLQRWLNEHYGKRRNNDRLRCIEFGAGTALPSLFLGHLMLLRRNESQTKTTTTIKPFIHITDAKQYRNIRQILLSLSLQPKELLEHCFFRVSPHNWGEGLGKDNEESPFLNQECRFPWTSGEEDPPVTYDLIIVSDCIYNPTYHRELLQSISATLKVPAEPNGEGGGRAFISFSLHGNTPDKDIWDFIEKQIPEQRHSTYNKWRLQARPIQRDIVGEKVNEGANEERQFGWHMEEKMKILGLWTSNIDPKRWYSYMYEITWVQ